MDDDDAFGAGAGKVAMALHISFLTYFIKKGLMTPFQVRELLDGLEIQYEAEMSNPDERSRTRASRSARRLVGQIREVLEMMPEMK